MFRLFASLRVKDESPLTNSFFFLFFLFNDQLMMDDLLVLVIMDNKHYFRLYLIRIKHDLLLFALLLTAIQSLIYLILAFVSEKVKN